MVWLSAVFFMGLVAAVSYWLTRGKVANSEGFFWLAAHSAAHLLRDHCY